ncbi:MAG: sigma-70 family RNA polymerase sigma factor [Ginsengibacter sp.]
MTLNIDRETILWNQFRNGNEESFITVFRNYYSNLYNYGCKITQDHNLVEDCIQDLFMDMWRTGGKAEIISIRAYVFKAFKFKLLKALGKISRVPNLQVNSSEHTFELSHEMFLISQQENLEQFEKLQAALLELSPRQKEIIYLKYYSNLSYEEVSDIMNINYQAARNLVYQSIKVLKKILAVQLILSLISIYLN